MPATALKKPAREGPSNRVLLQDFEQERGCLVVAAQAGGMRQRGIQRRLVRGTLRRANHGAEHAMALVVAAERPGSLEEHGAVAIVERLLRQDLAKQLGQLIVGLDVDRVSRMPARYSSSPGPCAASSNRRAAVRNRN